MSEQPTKHCRKCDTTKPHSQFHRSRCRHDGLENACKACRSAQQKAARDLAQGAGSVPTPPRHRTREEIEAKRRAIVAELERDPCRTDLEICVAAGAGRDLVARVRSDMDMAHMLAVSRHRPCPPSPRTMRAIACATTDELRLFHPSYVAEARRMGIVP